MNVAVLVSGGGTNLQNIIDAIEEGKLKNAHIQAVISDRNCYAIDRALDKDLNTFLLERSDKLSSEIEEVLTDLNIDLIILAGFLSILSVDFCKHWENKIINIHPSLLPKYGGKGMYGSKVHQAVLDAGEKESGVTVHFVTGGVDEGQIILQKNYLIEDGDTIESLQRKAQKIEQEILISAINKFNEKLK